MAGSQQVGSGRYRSRGVSELIDGAFSLYRRNLLLILVAIAVVEVPVAILRFILVQTAGLPTVSSTIGALGNAQRTADLASRAQVASVALTLVSTAIVAPVTLMLLSVVVQRAQSAQPATLSMALHAVAAALPALFVIGAIETILTVPYAIAAATLNVSAGPNPTQDALNQAAGNSFIVVALLFLHAVAHVFILLAPCAAVVERVSGLRALRRSWMLVKGAFWRTVGVLILVTIVTGIVALLVGLVLAIPGRLLSGSAADAADTTAQAVAGIVAAPIGLLTIALLYFDRRIRREAYDIEMLAAAL